MMTVPEIAVTIVFATMTVVTFALFVTDKSLAKRKRRRIPESTLLGASFFMGGVGGLLGMALCRHKTKHAKFCVLVPLFAATAVAVTILTFVFA